MRKLGIYVQVPFCQTKCTYCNFHTGVVARRRVAAYVEGVCWEIREHWELLKAAGVDWDGRLRRSGPDKVWTGAAPLQRKGEIPSEVGERPTSEVGSYTERSLAVDTVYIGGGTPSLLDPAHLQNILDAIGATFTAELAEVTLEADPETIEAEKTVAWVRAGINRVSFGLQSFSDRELVAAGRMHRRADIYRAVPILREAGIRNISFDLIAGLPHQTKESWGQSLEELAVLAPEHVSVYLLEIDEGSRLGKELLQGGGKYSAGAGRGADEMGGLYETVEEYVGGGG